MVGVLGVPVCVVAVRSSDMPLVVLTASVVVLAVELPGVGLLKFWVLSVGTISRPRLSNKKNYFLKYNYENWLSLTL